MLKTETQRFGETPPVTDTAGAVLTPGNPGVEVTCTQMPCSLQREVFAWLLSQFPENLPENLIRGRKATAEGAANFAYQVARRILAAPGGVAYLQKQFGQHSIARVQRNGKWQTEPLDEGLCDELFGARFSVLLEWLVYSLIFNFMDLINLLPDWGKELPAIVAAAMAGETPAEPRAE